MLKQFVVRTTPVTHNPMLVDATSRHDNKLKAIIENKEVEIDMEFYAASGSVDISDAHKIVQAYAQKANIAETEVLVRHRLPKTFKKKQQRHTNDANLNGGGQPFQRRATDKPQEQHVKADAANDELAKAAQTLHDSSKVDEAVKPLEDLKKDYPQKEKKAEGKATPENPEGATVVPLRTKRKYERKQKEQSARSKAAYSRYLKELERTNNENPVIMEPVATNATQAEVDQATLDLALQIAKILKANPGTV